MILVDTSVWVELLRAKPRHPIKEEVLLRFVTCGPILQEVLQGLLPAPQSESFRRALLSIPVLSDPLPTNLFLTAADIFQQGRRRGITIRSSVDCLIAAVAMENLVPVWHRDRDFEAIARYTGLDASPPPWPPLVPSPKPS
jgi:hypothetical protein